MAFPEITRFLTPEEKEWLLAGWQDRISALPPDFPLEGRGGLGYVDPLMIPWCAFINEMDGICTSQSCCGHRNPDDSMSDGCLWLRLSESVSKQFDLRAFDLAKQKGMTRVRRLYMEHGKEMAEIWFEGQGQGKLHESMSSIVEFLTSISYPGGISPSSAGTGGYDATPSTEEDPALPKNFDSQSASTETPMSNITKDIPQ